MLIQHPEEFARVAEEWAVEFAKAPPKSRGESSGGSAANEMAKQREKKSKEQEEAERVAQYAPRTRRRRTRMLTSTDLVGTTRTSSTALC
jgi:hypothetical protein